MITNLEEKESFYQKILDSINNINQLYPPVESTTFLNKMDTLFDDIKRYKVFARQNEYQDYRQFLDNVKTHPMTLDFELLSRFYFLNWNMMIIYDIVIGYIRIQWLFRSFWRYLMIFQILVQFIIGLVRKNLKKC